MANLTNFTTGCNINCYGIINDGNYDIETFQDGITPLVFSVDEPLGNYYFFVNSIGGLSWDTSTAANWGLCTVLLFAVRNSKLNQLLLFTMFLIVQCLISYSSSARVAADAFIYAALYWTLPVVQALVPLTLDLNKAPGRQYIFGLFLVFTFMHLVGAEDTQGSASSALTDAAKSAVPFMCAAVCCGNSGRGISFETETGLLIVFIFFEPSH